MRFVEMKAADQLDVQSLHRVRDRLVGEGTALINQLRAVLLEHHGAQGSPEVGADTDRATGRARRPRPGA